jgi:hypothetical protein
MPEERISQPVAGIATPHDRPSDAGRYERIEDARSSRRRPSKRQPDRAGTDGGKTSDASQPAQAEVGVRGTRLDVIA